MHAARASLRPASATNGAATVQSLSSYYVQTLRRVFRHPRAIFAFVGGSLMHGVGHAVMALAAAACAQSVLGQRAPWLRVSGLDAALTLAWLGLGAVLAKVVGGALAASTQAEVSGELGCDLRLRVLDGWMHAVACGQARHPDHGEPANALETSTSARALGALTSGVREVELGLAHGVMAGVRAMVQLVPLAALLLALAPRLGVGALLALGLFGAMSSRARNALKRAHSDAGKKADALLEAADDAVKHAELWATYGAQGRVRAQVAALGQSWTRQSSRLELLGGALSGSSELLAALALVIVFGLVRLGWVTSPDASLLPFAVVFFLAYRPLRELGDARGAWLRARAGLDRLEPWMSTTHAGELESAPTTERARWTMAPLHLGQLALLHGDLSPLSIDLAPGEIVVLRGPTGIGKSSLLRTLLGLERASSGELRYGDSDISQAPAGLTTRPFAWVPQDAPLLLGTLDENINLAAAPHQTDPLRLIGAERLRSELGDRVLGRDRTLSGGERQWVAIARAIATEQPILLLDEPTSGLDPASQRLVLEAIRRLRGARSVLLVTHREEPASIADRVILLT